VIRTQYTHSGTDSKSALFDWIEVTGLYSCQSYQALRDLDLIMIKVTFRHKLGRLEDQEALLPVFAWLFN